MAERAGFEPARPLRVYTLSKRADSTTLTPFRDEFYRRIFIAQIMIFGNRMA